MKECPKCEGTLSERRIAFNKDGSDYIIECGNVECNYITDGYGEIKK